MKFTVPSQFCNNRDAGYSVNLTNGVVLDRVVARDPYRRSLVKAITNSASGVPYNPLAYTYDLLNRVTARNTDTFDYNARSEVTSAIIQPAHINRYAFDNIGNALWASLNSVTNIYTANELNQYFLISNHVNHVNPVQISPAYDLDGNMTWDGRFNYTYDAENRLVAAYSNGLCVVSNAYDHLSRRVLKISRGGAETRGFVYDGWLPVLEIVATASGVTTNHYVWGKDLSGTLQGAGGVGGLLAVSLNGAWYFPFYDNNGNIIAYADEQGAIVAEYTHDAFGRTIAKSGTMADSFRHRFSTKYYDSETGLYYYGYRFYAPELMRWLNRDPIEERGGVNVYAYCRNSPVILLDWLGLLDIDVMFYGTALTDILPFLGGRTVGNYYMDFIANSLGIANRYRQNQGQGASGARTFILRTIDVNGDMVITKDEVRDLNLKLIGYSWGAITAINIAHDLSKSNERVESYYLCTKVPVKRLITIDPITFLNPARSIKNNVQVFRNYYQQKGGEYRVWLRRTDGIVEFEDGGTVLSRGLCGARIGGIDVDVNAVQVRIDTDRRGVQVSDGIPGGMLYSEMWSYGDFINHDMVPWYVKADVINDYF
ncbi:MAG: RHS repeat-associated core domain-containing protein [Kiritimatiellia bacterium]